MVDLNYERDMSNSYIVFKVLRDELEEHAIKMMHYNQISHLITLSEKTENGHTYLYYDITGKVSLLEWAKQNPVDYSVLQMLITSLLKLTGLTQEFLLTEGCILLNQQTVFLDLEKKACFFLYLPYSDKSFNMKKQVRMLIQELFPLIHKQDEKAISLIHKLRMVMEDENFSVEAFKRILEFEESILSATMHMRTDEVTVLKNEEARAKVKVKHRQESPGKNNKLTFVLLQLVLGIVVWLCVSNWLLGEANTVLLIIKVILLLSGVGICELLMITKVLLEQSAQEEPETDYVIEEQEVCSIPIKEEKIKSDKWGWDNDKSERLKREHLISSKRAYLINGEGVKAPIIKTPFVVGSLREAVDFCIKDEGVSNVHFKITQEDGLYYLMDLNSEGGTHLNEFCISPENKIIVYDGDLIHLGHGKYYFRLI